MSIMLLAVQTPDGTKRIECRPSDSSASFFKKVQAAFNFDSGVVFILFRKRERTDQILTQPRKTVSSYNLKHGDTIYLTFKSPPADTVEATASTSSTQLSTHFNSIQQSRKNSQILTPPTILKEDEIDIVLFKQNGYIQRERDEKLCQHSAHGKCVHCIPVEPYNEDYLREQNIKHLSFHSYLRKLTGGVDRGKFAALENISCKIKPGCKEHSPWPQGICTKCQPSAITLNRQTYRHVDNVMFENPLLAERFFNYWRCTGHQRMGILYGRYEHHKDVPLGIKAVVAAIYEPPQEGSPETIKLLPDERSEIVDKIAASLGLVKVGWIFTDLVAEDLKKGTVKHLRNISTYFLSAQECIMAGNFQNQNPNPCKLSPDGYFGSKFTTICVTGDSENHVHMEGYQVSNQCMALVRDSCLVPTLDAPELGYVKESTNEQYVPDVFYKAKDNYGNEVTQLARPLPIEYLLVDIPVATPLEPLYSFYADSSIQPFPVENRMIIDHIQDFSCLARYLRQFSSDQFLQAASDFHLLLYLATMDMLPLKDDLDPLLEAVKNKSASLASNWVHNEHWATIQQLLEAEGLIQPQSGRTESASNSSSNSMWTCIYCTYINQAETSNCEVCGLPK